LAICRSGIPWACKLLMACTLSMASRCTMSRLFSPVVLEKPLIGAAHAFLVQLVSFQAPIAGTLSAPADTLHGQVAVVRRLRDAQRPTDVINRDRPVPGQRVDHQHLGLFKGDARSAAIMSAGTGHGQSGFGAILNQAVLELGECGEDVKINSPEAEVASIAPWCNERNPTPRTRNPTPSLAIHSDKVSGSCSSATHAASPEGTGHESASPTFICVSAADPTRRVGASRPKLPPWRPSPSRRRPGRQARIGCRHWATRRNYREG